MESPEAKLFLEIQNRITDKVPEIKYIDQNLAQYLKDDLRQKMIYPCALIDFNNTDFTELQGNIQMATVTISITLFFDIWNATNNLTPLAIKQEGLLYNDITHKLYSALQGFNASFTGPLIRTNQKSQNNNEIGLKIVELTFTTTYEDWTLNDDNYVGLTFTARP